VAGRGAGKTKAGSEWVRRRVKEGFGRIGLIAPTAGDGRDVIVEGESGILSVSWERDRTVKGDVVGRPLYEPSKRRLTWENGAIAMLFSAEEPERLRGPQHDSLYCDELGSWSNAQDTWDMAMFGLRLGTDPRTMISTTPRPTSLFRQLIKANTSAITRATTYANRANLAPAFFRDIVSKYEGTRLGRQELLGELVDDVEGSLWPRSVLEKCCVEREAVPDLVRVVVGVDPATAEPDGESTGRAETGIVVAGLGIDGMGYVLDDLSCRATPDAWARRAISGLDRHDGDAIIAETNQGGAMVSSTIRAVRPTVKIVTVHAARGKVTRAEPISALYEQGRVKHVGRFTALEDQMALFTQFGIEGSNTGDRVDALVWALTELFPRMTRRPRSGTVQVEGLGGYQPLRY
jgi:phage terminase large subunit-like protein